MSRIRGISEEIKYAFNPLPLVKDERLLEMAELPLRDPLKNADPFCVMWKYGGTLQDETVHLNPGDFLALRASEAAEFLVDTQEVGCVLVTDPHDEMEVYEARLKGLKVAVRFWSERGNVRVQAMRRVHGVSKDDLDDYRYEWFVYFYNQAKADVCMEEIKMLSDSPPQPVNAETAEQE